MAGSVTTLIKRGQFGICYLKPISAIRRSVAIKAALLLMLGGETERRGSALGAHLQQAEVQDGAAQFRVHLRGGTPQPTPPSAVPYAWCRRRIRRMQRDV